MVRGTWDDLASVRNSERHLLEELPGQALFPASLFPALAHPMVTEGDPAVAQALQAQRLLLYLDFTTELESLVVNPVLASIGLGKTPLDIRPVERVEAWQIYVDEAYHALNSVDLASQVGALVGIDHQVRVAHGFKSIVDRASAEADADADLVRLCAAVVSETLITGTLEQLPRDESVHPTVRAIVKDHEVDERRHHAYFTRAFTSLWPQLSPRDKMETGPLFADFIRGFLEPDVESLIDVTALALGSRDAARTVVHETRPSSLEETHRIRHSARATIALMRRVGVLESDRAHDRFAQLNLV